MRKWIGLIMAAVLFCTGCSSNAGKNTVNKEQEKSNVIRLYSMEDSEMLWQSVMRFEDVYPYYEVRIEIGMTEEDGMTRSDAIRSLNTKMMAGDGPDILFLDGLSIEQYMEKGLLEDASAALDGVREKGEVLFENVAMAYSEKDKVYAVPTFFSVPAVFGDENTVTPEEVDNLAGSLDTKSEEIIESLAQNESALHSVPMLLFASWNKLFPTEGALDREVLSAFLQETKMLMDRSDIDLFLPYYEAFPPFQMMIDCYPDWIIDPMEFVWGSTKLQLGTISDASSCTNLQNVDAINPIFYKYLNAEKEKLFFPSRILGISSTCENKEAASAFMEYFLSDDNLGNYDGRLPVNRTSFEKILSPSATKAYMTTLYEKHEAVDGVDIYTLTKEEAQEFLTFVDGVNTALHPDMIILEEILTQAKRYVYGGESLDTVVHSISEKIELYQAE